MQNKKIKKTQNINRRVGLKKTVFAERNLANDQWIRTLFKAVLNLFRVLNPVQALEPQLKVLWFSIYWIGHITTTAREHLISPESSLNYRIVEPNSAILVLDQIIFVIFEVERQFL